MSHNLVLGVQRNAPEEIIISILKRFLMKFIDEFNVNLFKNLVIWKTFLEEYLFMLVQK